MNNWNASNYRQRKAARLALIKPSWIVNPETGEEFYLREVGSLMSSVLAGYMPGGLTKIAVEAWKEQGVEGLNVDQAAELAASLTPEQLAEGDREMASTTEIVQASCVIPLLSKDDPNKVEFTEEWKADAIRGLKEKDPHFDPERFDPKNLVLHPKELDNKDATFLFQWAQGIAGMARLKGDNVVGMNDVARFRKVAKRSSRARPDGSKVEHTA